MSRFFVRIIAVAAFALVAGCATNPVTGKSELVGLSEAQEIEIGETNYAPLQQASGGEYDIDPELTEYIQQVGAKLAEVSDRPLPYEFVVLNDSVPNAWALPGGKIAINRGLLTELNSEAELAAVLGHEVVHAAAGHTSQRQGLGNILQGVLVGTAVLASGSQYGDIAVGAAGLGGQLISQQYGQGAELESDKYGMRYMSRAGYDPQGAVELQETFVRLSEGREPDWLSGLFASHPPSNRRVEENRKTASKLPPGGERGVEAYARAMAKTMAAKPAYDAYDEGMKALSDDDTGLALEQAQKAIDLFPEEANFYMLRGLARATDEQYDMALTNFNSAVRRRDSFFQYYLYRGLVQEKLENYDEAVSDLEKSNSLLPTAQAYFSLGSIAVEQGDREAALENFGKIAGDKSTIARAARDEMAKLEISENPQKYVLRRCDPGSDGNLVISVKNNTSLDIAGVELVVDYTDENGRPRQLERRINGIIEPGKVIPVTTGLGPYARGGNCPVRITTARIYP